MKQLGTSIKSSLSAKAYPAMPEPHRNPTQGNRADPLQSKEPAPLCQRALYSLDRDTD